MSINLPWQAIGVPEIFASKTSLIAVVQPKLLSLGWRV